MGKSVGTKRTVSWEEVSAHPGADYRRRQTPNGYIKLDSYVHHVGVGDNRLNVT